MAINIPSKSSRATSQIRDAIRIIAWQAYKADNKDSGLKPSELYKEFDAEWQKHEIQKMDLEKIKQFVETLGYTLVELNKLRSEYYESRKGYKAQVVVEPDDMPEF